MNLSIVIVNYNVRHYVSQCLHSVRKAVDVLRAEGGMDADIYVVDNHSKDDSVVYLQKNFTDINLIASIYNLGFSRGNNLAIRQSEGDFVLLLNPDTVIGEHTLLDVMRFAVNNKDAGAIGVRMLNADGSNALESRRGLPTPMTSLYKILGLCRRYPDHPRYARYYMSNMSWDKPGEIDICSGAFLLLRRESLDKVGLLDEDFFMYGEDIDLSYRVQQGGWKNFYVPTPILHYKGESTQHSSFRYVHVFYQAMLIFYSKHFRSAWWLSVPVRLAVCAKAIFALLSIQYHRVKKFLGLEKPFAGRSLCYVFFGSASSIASCRNHARVHGLDAKFVEASETTYPQGHKDFIPSLDPDSLTCMVYDVSAYSYDSILKIFSENSHSSCSIGFYHPDINTIITHYDIFQ